MSEEGLWEEILERYPGAIGISAKTGQGLEDFSQAVADALSRFFADIDVEMGVDNGRLMAYLARHGEVLTREYKGERLTMHCRIPQRFMGQVRGDGVTVTDHVYGNSEENRLETSFQLTKPPVRESKENPTEAVNPQRGSSSQSLSAADIHFPPRKPRLEF